MNSYGLKMYLRQIISTPHQVIAKNTSTLIPYHADTTYRTDAAQTSGEVSSTFSWRMNLCVCVCVRARAEHHSVRDLAVISQHPGQMTKALSAKSKQVGLSATPPCRPDVRH